MSEKLDLSDDIVKVSAAVKAALSATATVALRSLPGSRLGLLLGQAPASVRPLSVEQIKGLAEMVFLGLSDLSYNNLFFTREGKLALIDTDPEARKEKKDLWKTLLFKIVGSKDDYRFNLKMQNLQQLKLLTTNEEAFQAIRDVEKKPMMIQAAKLIAKTVATIFIGLAVLSFLPTSGSERVFSLLRRYPLLFLCNRKIFQNFAFLKSIYNVRSMPKQLDLGRAN